MPFMKNSTTGRVSRIGAFGLLCLAPVMAGAQLLDDKTHLKILSNKAMLMQLNQSHFDDLLKKQNAPTSQKDVEQYVGRVGCGSVEIGNQSVDSGIAKEISVVIVGDVINFGNRCSR